MDERQVVLSRTEFAEYPSSAPFHPDEAYPEFGSKPRELISSEPNYAYRAIRQAMQLGGLDAARFGTPQWNPLAEFIQPGQFVLLKPNLVKETHPRDPDGWLYTITHGSIIRAVADYVFKALQGRGKIVVADAPQTDSSFDAMVGLLKLDEIQNYYRQHGLDFELTDLRKEQWTCRGEVITKRTKLAGDPRGYVAFDLADRSEFHQHCGAGRYYGADYDDGEVNRHHSGGRHEYLLAGTAVKCDVFINLPKLKTHKKAGITVNLKNLVGVNGDKNWLPHHTVGTPLDGGDQFPAPTLKRSVEHRTAQTLRRIALKVPGVGPWLLQRAKRIGRPFFGDTAKVVRSGNWFGNDTTWRMCLDLNKAVLYGNPDGTLREPNPGNRKTYLSFVDGIIGGQGDGPMDPDPLESKVVLFGTNPVTVDAVAGILMGFDLKRIPIVWNGFRARTFSLAEWKPEEIECRSNYEPWNGSLLQLSESEALLDVAPHFGWTGHIKARETAAANPE